MHDVVTYLKTVDAKEDIIHKDQIKEQLDIQVILQYPELEARYYELLQTIYDIDITLEFPEFSDSILTKIPSTLYDTFMMLPLYIKDQTLYVAVSDPKDIMRAKQLTSITGYDIVISFAYKSQLKAYIVSYKNYIKYDIFKKLMMQQPPIKPLKKQSLSLEEGPMIVYAKAMIEMCMTYEASDIHLIYDGLNGYMKCRIEGILHVIQTHDLLMHEALIRRFLVLASLDTINKDLPQDGMFHMMIDDKSYTFRLAVLKAYYSFHAVIRIIHTYHKFERLDQIGLEDIQLEEVKRYILKQTGCLIVTGSTGSGKSTTVHAVLDMLHKDEKHTITIEHPVEHIHKGMTQIDMKDSYGISFEEVLKHCLRMDPDHIFIGEIRDQKTAQIMIHAALTGHFVCGTMHAFKADHVHQRLMHLGIDSVSMSHIPLLNIHQILIPKMCVHCKGTGCYACMKRGFIKRIAIFELNHYDSEKKHMIRIGKSIKDTLEVLYQNNEISLHTLENYS
jgi:type II secretory ATPase GspE/PulE/Tfp pilus assembly ATPase PilB-like protein